MDRHELNRVFDQLAPTAEQEKAESLETAANPETPDEAKEASGLEPVDSVADNGQIHKTPQTDPSANEGKVSSESDFAPKQPVSFGYFLTVCLVCALLVLGMALSIILLIRSRRKRRRRKR